MFIRILSKETCLQRETRENLPVLAQGVQKLKFLNMLSPASIER